MIKSNLVHIGTSGWNYKHWQGTFYPLQLKSKNFLSFYSEKLYTVEINSSFYHLPKLKTFENWRDTVPKNFIFAVKASRFITHIKRLKDAKDAVDNFIERAKELQQTLGPILFQLPPHWKCNIDRLKSFLEILPKDYRYTFEFRDNSWWNEKIYQILRNFNVAFCIFHLAGQLTPKESTADFIYIRLHGPGDKYQGLYDKQTIKTWIEDFNQWNKQGKEVFCYFDNDEYAYAVQNALEMQHMIYSF